MSLPDESTGAQVTEKVRQELQNMSTKKEGFPWLVLSSWLLPLVVTILIAIVPAIRSDGVEKEQVESLIKATDQVEQTLAQLDRTMIEYKASVSALMTTLNTVREDQKELEEKLDSLLQKQSNDRTSIRTLHAIMENELSRQINLSILNDPAGD